MDDIKGKRTKYCSSANLQCILQKKLRVFTTELGAELEEDHTTVIHSIDKIKDAIKTDSSWIRIQSLKEK